MGRIKPPSGKVFRRESKPGYMVEKEVRKGKNWQLQLDDTMNILKGAEQLYTSPLLRDAVGAVGEGFSMIFGGSDEPTVEDAAIAKVGAPPKIPEGGEGTVPPPLEQEIISPQVQAMQPKSPARKPYDPFTAPRDVVDAYDQAYYQKPQGDSAFIMKQAEDAAASLATAQLQQQEILAPPTATLMLPDAPATMKDGKVYSGVRLTETLNNMQDMDPVESSDIAEIGAFTDAMQNELEVAYGLLEDHQNGIGDPLDERQLAELTKYAASLESNIDATRKRTARIVDVRQPADINPEGLGSLAPLQKNLDNRREAISNAIADDPQKYLGGLANEDRAKFDTFYQNPEAQATNAKEIILKMAATKLKGREAQALMLAESKDKAVASQMGTATGTALGEVAKMGLPLGTPTVAETSAHAATLSDEDLQQMLTTLEGYQGTGELTETGAEQLAAYQQEMAKRQAPPTTKELEAQADANDRALVKLGGTPLEDTTTTTEELITETPAVPSAPTRVPSMDVSRTTGYVPPPAEKAMSNPMLAATGRLLQTRGATDALNVRNLVKQIVEVPGMNELLSQEPEETMPEFLANMVELQQKLLGQMPTQAPAAPTTTTPLPKIAPGMNLGQAQAMAAQLALQGGSNADLVELMDDVGNITGVGSGGGGFARWVAGGRPGGYFMDPTGASQALKKAYDTALTARRSGRSKQLADAYKQVQIQKAQQGMVKQVADMKRQRADAASKIADRQNRAVERRRKTEMKIQEHNYRLPAIVVKDWLDISDGQYDLGKALARKAGSKGGLLPADKDLAKYQAQLNASAKALESFSLSSQRASDDGTNKLDSAIASAEKGERINVEGLSAEEIVALYGSDMSAYKRDVRKEQAALTDEQKAELKKTLEARKKKLKARNKNIADLRRKLSSTTAELMAYLGQADSKKVKKEKLDKLNEEIEDLKDELTRILETE